MGGSPEPRGSAVPGPAAERVGGYQMSHLTHVAFSEYGPIVPIVLLGQIRQNEISHAVSVRYISFTSSKKHIALRTELVRSWVHGSVFIFDPATLYLQCTTTHMIPQQESAP
jgi:hypothetical protein